MDNDSKPLHVILGAGQVGTRLDRHLRALGHDVRLVRHASGDMGDLAYAVEATRGAAVIYDCMNPRYHRWAEELLPIARGALHGATQHGARLVALDNVYMYGRPSGPMTEATPMAPCSKKGALRKELADVRLAAHRSGSVDLSIARASDFFGPDVQLSGWSDRFFERIYAGKAGECIGDPDMLHSYTFIDDVVSALAILGTQARSGNEENPIWHIPTAPAETSRALAKRVGKALGLDVELSRVPKLLLRGLGLFDPFMREIVEMTYQFEMPYILDSSRFESTFGMKPTPTDEAVAVTAAWARTKFARKAAA